jgi:ATP-binding cassette subfamily A (ABC1) protein 3
LKCFSLLLILGIFPPTSGTARINGYDICTNMKGVRRSLGLCPQTNTLFPELTVEEHLRFFCSLKGLGSSKVGPEVERMMKAIGLQDKKRVKADALSGGMKRRLSVGIAFCANSKVLLWLNSSLLKTCGRNGTLVVFLGRFTGRAKLRS